MIEIRRPPRGPGGLKRTGEKQTHLDCTEYDTRPQDFQSGVAQFPKKKYYSAPAVKELLVRIHHGKCCYCETRLSSINLHVEHFRPKSGVRQTRTQKQDELPGYYWLAYHWDNLLISCADCNCRHKRTLFPLSNPHQRARSHHDDISRERPLFVDPARQDPRDHIRFDDDTPRSITPEGATTIDEIGLRRSDLREARMALLDQIRYHKQIMDIAVANPGIAAVQRMAVQARDYIEAAMEPEAEYSSMVVDFVTSNGII